MLSSRRWSTPNGWRTWQTRRAISWRRGIRHIIWSAMGGSVQTVYCLKRMGYLDLPGLTIHPLDSTDPASLNRTLEEIAAAEGIDLGALEGQTELLRAAIRQVLATTMITGVSMGMTQRRADHALAMV